MKLKLALPLLACLAVAGCGSPPPPSPSPIDFAAGIWDREAIVPTPGYLAVDAGSGLIGLPLDDSDGVRVGTIDYLLADPTSGRAQYAAVSSPAFGGFVAVPMTALKVTPSSATVDVSQAALMGLPRMTAATLFARYPRTALTVPLRAPLTPVAAAPVVTTALPPPPAQAAPAQTPPRSGALDLVSHGSVVGYPVVDAEGRPIGTVDAVAAQPGTGAVRYVIVTNPSFGFDSFIVVPAPDASARGNEVVLTASAADWLNAPRYRGDQIRQIYGASGAL